jgi:FHA domain
MKRSDVSLFDRLFGKSRAAATAARRAELEGDLPRAALLWAEADRADEAARVTLLRGDAEVDSAKRFQLYVQAVALAPGGHAVRDIARRKRALLALGIAREGATSAAARLDLLEAARELEALGDATHAADAYALAGDLEGEARALVEGGEIDRLEHVLDRDRDRARTERLSHDAHGELDRLLASGKRRAALALAEELTARARGDVAAAERLKTIRAQRSTGPCVVFDLRGKRMQMVLGDEVMVGRTEGAITISSHAVSRRHLLIARGGDAILVRDLESRNGTLLRGMRVVGAIPVAMAEGLELKLGGEVPLHLSASSEIEGALAIEVAGSRYVAPLGPARLGVGAWRLETAPDGWLELVTDDDPPAYIGGVRIEARTPLLAGDAIAANRGEAGVFCVA